jgi:hypothetical protein
LASYDEHLLEVGLGLGAQTVNDVALGQQRGSGTLIAQVLRLGSVDGLNLAVRSDFVLFASRFEFSGLSGSAQIPLGQSSWLVARGAGSRAGFGYGELGLRALLRGRGGPGSVYLMVTAGGATVFRAASCSFEAGFEGCSSDESSTSGPMAGAGLAVRF